MSELTVFEPVTSKCVIPGFEKANPKDQAKELRAICRRVLGTDEGKIVLNMLLTDLRLYEPSRDEAEQALNNYAKFFIRERLGVVNTVSLTDAVMAEANLSRGGK
jgi:hypothetical protein